MGQQFKVYASNWLSEEQKIGAHSARNVQCISFKCAVITEVDSFATLHTLLQSFATHPLETGVDILCIQELLAYSRIIYTHISQNAFKGIERLLVRLELKSVYSK